MNLSKLRIGVVGAITITGVMASLVIQHRVELRTRESEEEWRQQDTQIATLAAEQERLSSVAAQAKNSPPEGHQPESHELGIELERLRKHIKALETQLEPTRQARLALFASEHPTPEYRNQRETMTAGKIKDASSLFEAAQHYLANPHDQFPSNLDQLVPFSGHPKGVFAGYKKAPGDRRQGGGRGERR